MDREPDNIPDDLTLAEQLTLNFYNWEQRGRGLTLWEQPVMIEPVFEPFSFKAPIFRPAADDGRHETWLSLVSDSVRRFFQDSPLDLPKEDEEIEQTEIPAFYGYDMPLCEITLSLPPQHKTELEAAENFLLGLCASTYFFSFEIIGAPEAISIQMTCHEPDAFLLKQQLKAFFPDTVLYQESPVLASIWDREKPSVVSEFVLRQEFMRPLRTHRKFEPDPLISLIGSMDNLEKGELAVFQVLFQSVRHDWAGNMLRAVTDFEGHSFFANDQDMLRLAKEKIERPLYAAVIRIACQSPDEYRTHLIEKALNSGLQQFSNPPSNELACPYEDYELQLRVRNLLCRETHRSGILLNSAELVSMVHLPSISVRAAKLRRELKKSKAAPVVSAGHQLVLGENLHQGKKTSVSLSSEQRFRHMHLIGATGTGKSTLLLNMIVQDIKNGQGIAVLDPHGDLIERIMGYIPEERINDVILLDPADSEYPVGLNILSAYSEIDKTVLASDLVSVFRRLSTSWGDQMNSIFSNAVLAFLESDLGGTLINLRRFLVEKKYREEFLQTVKDKEVLYYWQKEFPLLTGKVQAPILTRLDTFLRPKPIRNMVMQKEGLNFRDVLEGKKIFLAKLAQGLIGMENAFLLGTIIASKLHQAAMARQSKAESERKDFFLYVDEFQNFATKSMSEILSGGRKYHFGLVLAHQDLRQLLARDPELANSVISNPGVRICFRLGDFDARRLEEGFSFFDAKDLQNLGIGESICRIERIENDFNLKTFAPSGIDPEIVKKRQEAIIESCRRKYAVPVSELEEQQEEKEIILPPQMIRAEKEISDTETKQSVSLRMRRNPEGEEPELEGKGGREHKYLQHFIQKAGEDYGYRAIIEHPVPIGTGMIDVYLERPGLKMACEISITTNASQEFSNIKKCLDADLDLVLIVSQDKSLLKLQQFVSTELEEQDRQKVLFFESKESLILFLKEQASIIVSKEEWVKGYKVKVKETQASAEKSKSILKSMSEVFVSSFQRSKGKK